jgi:hypothetical protein
VRERLSKRSRVFYQTSQMEDSTKLNWRPTAKRRNMELK